MTNHLAHTSSPYLLQHAENPVDWYPWGQAALDKAQNEDKPIFLSIGYAACHWCHVMAHESFEDPAIAALLNAGFVCIKVDREERPDLDSLYMSFVVATTGGGGWPMSVFLTPNAKPFYGGTYYPPEPRHNLPAFRDVLQTVDRLWRTDRQSILAGSQQLVEQLAQQQASQSSAGPALDPDLLDHATAALSRNYDGQRGGWGSAPKFPQPMLVEYLLRRSVQGDQAGRDMALHTLRAMAQGGMYDVLGGGFARYSVDDHWHTPHFEKMLYDNAQLARVYLHAYQLTGETEFAKVCQETLDFCLREFSHPAGGFYSSLDADSGGEEGRYYLWTPAEIQDALGDAGDAEVVMSAYGVTSEGNFEQRNILRRVLDDEQLARRFQVSQADIPARLAGLRLRLLDRRTTRVRPAVDDKVLVSWNALIIAALAEAGRALGRPDYLQAARVNASFILERMFIDGRLKRSWRQGVVSNQGFLEDYSALGLSLLALYQADPDPHWYQASLAMLEQVQAHFQDPDGGYFDTSDEHETLIYRPKDVQDNATPSGNSMAAMLLLELASYAGRSDWRSQAEQMITLQAGLIGRYPAAFGFWLIAADFALAPVRQVAILGDPASPDTLNLLHPLWQGYYPHLVLAASPYPPADGSPPLLSNRQPLSSQPTAFVCQDFVCHLPVTDPQSMIARLSAPT